MFVRTENSFREIRIFPLKKFRRSAKNIETGRKISQFHSGKGRKNYSDEAKKSQKTDDPDEKTADYFLQADGKMQKRMRGRTEKSAGASEKISKYPDEKRINAYPEGWFILKKWIFYQKNTEKKTD